MSEKKKILHTHTEEYYSVIHDNTEGPWVTGVREALYNLTYICDLKIKWINEWMNEWMNEWINK